jgi:hypothetical protein
MRCILHNYPIGLFGSFRVIIEMDGDTDRQDMLLRLLY